MLGMKWQFSNLVPNRLLNMFDAFERKSKGCDKRLEDPFEVKRIFFFSQKPTEGGSHKSRPLSPLPILFLFTICD